MEALMLAAESKNDSHSGIQSHILSLRKGSYWPTHPEIKPDIWHSWPCLPSTTTYNFHIGERTGRYLTC